MAVPGKKANIQFSSSTTSMGSDEDLKVYCQSCDRDGPRLPAHGYCTNCSEHLCENCFTVHRRHKLSTHHTLLDKANMPQTMSSVTPSHLDNWTKQCPKHNIEIKFYCHNHKALLCSFCVSLEHTRKSCKVNYIPDVSVQVVNSKEYQDILKAINDMTMKANKTLQDMKEMNDRSNLSLSEALKDIKAFRTKINQRLDELEKQVERAAQVIQKENDTKLTRVEKECKDLLKSLKISSDAITQFNTSKQANDLFMEVKQAEKMITDYERSISKLTSLDVQMYNFEPNKEMSNLLSKEKAIGTLTGRLITHLIPKEVTNKDRIYIKTTKDKQLCNITGMTLLTPNLLIITDDNNKAVKIVDISRKSVLDQHKLDSWPYDVSSVSHDEIAVTIPDKQTIQFMSVSKNNLKKKHAVEVDGRCHGISCHKDKMVVTFITPTMVQILHINGTVLQTIQDEDIFSVPEYVTTSDNYIYVSDHGKRTIIKLNWQGDVKSKYDCRRLPYGLAMSDNETMFVCFLGDNTIREILEDFTKEQTVVQDIQCPQAVCWCDETSTLYISIDDEGIENVFIKIYKFSS